MPWSKGSFIRSPPTFKIGSREQKTQRPSSDEQGKIFKCPSRFWINSIASSLLSSQSYHKLIYRDHDFDPADEESGSHLPSTSQPHLSGPLSQWSPNSFLSSRSMQCQGRCRPKTLGELTHLPLEEERRKNTPQSLTPNAILLCRPHPRSLSRSRRIKRKVSYVRVDVKSVYVSVLDSPR